MKELDNKKMWESLIKSKANRGCEPFNCQDVLDALKDQGFEYKDGKIVSTKPLWENIPKGWYIAKKDFHDKDLDGFCGAPVFMEGEPTPKEKVFKIVPYMNDKLFEEYFRPATDEEIPHKLTNEMEDLLGKKEEPISEDLVEAMKQSAEETKLTKAKNGRPFFSEEDFNIGFSNGAQWQLDRIKEVLLSEVLPCFMHGGEADEVVAKLDEVLKQKK